MLARENPYRSECVERLAFWPQGEDWDAILARLARLDRRCAIVGPCGSGKTTMMEELAVRLRRDGWRTPLLRLRREENRGMHEWLQLVGADAVMLLDGAEQLSAPEWWRVRWLTRRAGGLVVTTHRCGRLPVLHECRVSAELLRGLIGELCGRGAVEGFDAGGLLERHGGNVRLALMEMYRMQAGT